MKKALNLLLGLSLMASAYAGSPVIKPAIAPFAPMILPPAPVSPTGSIALQATTYQYSFIYNTVTEGAVAGTSDSLYEIILGFYIIIDGTFGGVVQPSQSFTINITSGPFAGNTLDWPAEQEFYFLDYEAPTAPTANYTATTSPTTYFAYPSTNYPVIQAIDWLGDYPNN